MALGTRELRAVMPRVKVPEALVLPENKAPVAYPTINHSGSMLAKQGTESRVLPRFPPQAGVTTILHPIRTGTPYLCELPMHGTKQNAVRVRLWLRRAKGHPCGRAYLGIEDPQPCILLAKEDSPAQKRKPRSFEKRMSNTSSSRGKKEREKKARAAQNRH